MATPIIPTYSGTNWAPLKPLLALKENSTNSHPVADAIRERYKHFKGQEEEVWREIYSVGQMTALFMEGKQLLMPNPYTGGWKVLRPSYEDESTKRAMNLMQFYGDNCLTKWINSNPDIRVRPGNGSDKAELGARYAEVVIDHYEDKLYTVEFNIQEGLSAIVYGTYINRYRYDENLYGPEVLREIFGTQSLNIASQYNMCADCGSAGSEGYEEGCPQCGSQDLYREGGEPTEVNNVTGTEHVRMGDIIVDQLPLPACRWDLKKRAEESSWFMYSRRVPLTAIKHLMGNVSLPSGDTADPGLDILQSLAYSGQAMSGRSVGGQKKKAWEDEVVVTEFWMSVEDYGDIEIKGDEQTVSGENVPAGRLSDLFPDKLCVVGLNDMSVILGLYAESHKDRITTGTWHSKPNSGIGRGMADTVEVQKRFNTLDSQALAYLQSTATPGILYNQALIQSDEAQHIGSPKRNIPVDMRTMPEGSKLSDALWQFTPGSLPGQFLQYNHEFLNHMFQLTSLVTDFTGGLNPVVRNYTATGANISAALSNSLFTPMLAIKSSVRKRGAKIILDTYRASFPMERYFSLAGPHGSQQAISFKGIDVCEDLTLDVVRDSELPRNSYSKREDLINFFAVLGGADGYIALKERYPEMVGNLEHLWNVDTQSQSFDVITGQCRYRLAQMNGLFSNGIQLPEALLEGITPPISKLEPNQLGKSIWWQKFLDTDEGTQTPLPIRQAIEVLIQEHFINNQMQEQTVAYYMGVNQASAAVAPGALQLLGQHLMPQGAPAAGPEKVDPQEEAKSRVKYDKAPAAIQQQMEADAGFKPAPKNEMRPPLVQAQAQLQTARMKKTLTKPSDRSK